MGGFPQPKQWTFLLRGSASARVGGIALTLSALTGCALGFTPPAAQLVTTCVLPTDQIATLAGHWKTIPVPIAFHQGDFNADEVSAMTAAADVWNAFYLATQNIKQVIDYGGSSVRFSAQPVPTDVCAQGLLQGGVFTGNVVIYRQLVWPHSGVNSTMALTSFCTNPATPLPSTYMAYMEINFQGFFQQGLKQPDMQTIVGHEFGHLLGLYHSCDVGSTTAGKPDCNKTGISPDYQSAIMFPTFGFNSDLTGEQKRALQPNDEGRANCLYGSVGGQ
jgi:hypothetical protein